MDIFECSSEYLDQLFDDSYLKKSGGTVDMENPEFYNFVLNCCHECAKIALSHQFTTQGEFQFAGSMIEEVKLFMNKIVYREDGDIDSYFRNHGSVTKNLKMIYNTITCERSSTAPVERSFSIFNNIFTERRNRLTEASLCNVLTIKINVAYAQNYDYMNILTHYLNNYSTLQERNMVYYPRYTMLTRI